MGKRGPKRQPNPTQAAVRQRRWRERQSAQKALQAASAAPTGDLAAAYVEWAESSLRVPPGHPHAGQLWRVPAFMRDWLGDALATGVNQALLSAPRKNAKSASIASLILACLVGPLRRPGLQIVAVSLSANHAESLRKATLAIATASALPGLETRTRPPLIRTADGSEARYLAATNVAALGSDLDVGVCDEVGAWPDRGLYDAMLGSVTARNGRVLAISTRYDDSAGLVAEYERLAAVDDSTVCHVHAAPDGADPFSESAILVANPAVGDGIKSLDATLALARQAQLEPARQSAYLASELNLPAEPSAQTALSIRDYESGLVDVEPDPVGPVYVGLDAGGSNSMTALACFWPECGLLRVTAALPGIPALADRDKADAANGLYERLIQTGELRVYDASKVVPLDRFIVDALAGVDPASIYGVAADRFRQSEVEHALYAAGLPHEPDWRGMGFRDGSEDLRLFQQSWLRGHVVHRRDGLLLQSAIAESALVADPAGNFKLDRRRSRGKVDALVASVLAVSCAVRDAYAPRVVWQPNPTW